MTLNLIESPELMSYLQTIEANRRNYPVSQNGVFWGKPNRQRDWYFDDSMFAAMIEMQVRWYSTYADHEFQIALREKLLQTETEPAIRAYEQGTCDFELRTLMYIVGTRSLRWQWLCEDLGIDGPPTKFVTFRGTDRVEIAKAVVQAWLDDETEMNIPHSGLSSWSLLEGDPRSGARSYFFRGEVGALLVSEAPMENTFLDVLVDDGYFAHHGAREAEIVVGRGSPRLEITGNPMNFKAQVDGQEYRYEDRESARYALRRRGHWGN